MGDSVMILMNDGDGNNDNNNNKEWKELRD